MSKVRDRSGGTWEVVLEAIDADGVRIDASYTDPYCDSTMEAIGNALESWGREVDVVGVKNVTVEKGDD